MKFEITGIVREKESKRPVPNLLVRAFDKDLFFSDLLGNAITASDGTFALGYEGKDFQELFEKRPDIYLDIFGSATAQDPGLVGDKPIHTTKSCVRFNAGHQEFFLIEILRDKLGEDAPGTGILSTPEQGHWKGLIDDYLATHPIDFQYNSDKGIMTPRLECTADFGPEMRAIAVGDSGMVTVRVTNKGNGISFACYVQVYEGPHVTTVSDNPLQDYRLCDYKIMTINPGQTVDVKLSLNRFLAEGSVVGVCFDPFQDPRGFHLIDYSHDHVTFVNFIENPINIGPPI
jgi:hypothetical protein